MTDQQLYDIIASILKNPSTKIVADGSKSILINLDKYNAYPDDEKITITLSKLKKDIREQLED